MIVNGLRVETTDTVSPYTCTSVTGYSPLAAIPASVAFFALLENGNYKEWSICTHDGAGELTVERVTATLKSGTYADTSATAITKTGTTTVSLVTGGENVMTPAPGVSNVGSPDRYAMCTNMARWSNVSMTVSGNRQSYHPFYLSSAGVYAGLAFAFTGTISVDAKTALYACNEDGEPGPRLAVHDTAVTYSTDGAKTQSFDGGSLYLPAGWYYAFYWASASETIVGTPVDYLPWSPLGMDGGSFSPQGYAYKTLTWNASTTPPATADPDSLVANVRGQMGVYK